MALDDIHVRLIEGAAEIVTALNLSVIGGDRIYFTLYPDLTRGYSFAAGEVTDIQFPCLLLTMEDEVEDEGLNSDTGERDNRYPVRLWFADKTKDHGSWKELLRTRKKLWLAFADLAEMNGVPELVRCTVRRLVIVDRQLPAYQHLLSGGALTFETSEPR